MAKPRTPLTPETKARLGLVASTALVPPQTARERYAARAEARTPRPFVASPQQQAFFDWIIDGRGSLLLEAVAGAGKTTTLIQGLSRMNGTVFFGAYNKTIAAEIKANAEELKADRPGLYISTLHAAGFGAWMRAHPPGSIRVDEKKVGTILEQYAIQHPATRFQIEQSYGFITKLVSFAKQFAVWVDHGATDAVQPWYEIIDRFGLDTDLPDDIEIDTALGWAMDVYVTSANTCDKVVDFDDMIFAPLFHGTRMFQNDWVLIDERQDTNPARRMLAKRMLKPGGRLVAVGDTRQAIYGFTGADGGTQKFVDDFGCKMLPLTVTYRCPRAVVAYVRQWVDHIEAHPDAPLGVVRSVLPAPAVDGKVSSAPWFMYDVPAATDAILCRKTRPLIQTAFAMIREGIPCRVEGRDIGKGLIALARRWRVTSLDRLEERLTAWAKRQIENATAAKNERKAQEIEDKVETLRVLIDRTRTTRGGAATIEHLVTEIEMIFADNVAGVVTLCTGHKAKGREWPRVWWLQTLQPSYPMKEWERIEEDNIKYVIGTRAQQELVLIPPPPPVKK